MNDTPNTTQPDERATFEAAYAEHATRAHNGLRTFTAAEIAELREDDHYGGDRAYLNGVWQGWQMRASASSAAVGERFFAFEFEVWQNGEMVASASGPRDMALNEAMGYARQYSQDGPVRVFEVVRHLVHATPPSAQQEGGA